MIDWLIDLLVFYRHFQQYFSYTMATSFSAGGSRSTRIEPPTLDKQLVNFITCGCESSEPFFVIYQKLGANPRRFGDRLVWATPHPRWELSDYNIEKNGGPLWVACLESAMIPAR